MKFYFHNGKCETLLQNEKEAKENRSNESQDK